VGLEQPLTQLFRIHQANVAAKQDLIIAKTQLDQTQDAIALQVRQLYYNILINQQKLKASQEQLAAAQIKDEESRSDVARGNALEISALQSKACHPAGATGEPDLTSARKRSTAPARGRSWTPG
jgi:outer membrane protein TolC